MTITASTFNDLIACPHRVSMNLFGDPGEREMRSAIHQDAEGAADHRGDGSAGATHLWRQDHR